MTEPLGGKQKSLIPMTIRLNVNQTEVTMSPCGQHHQQLSGPSTCHGLGPLPAPSALSFPIILRGRTDGSFTNEDVRPQEDSNSPKCERRKCGPQRAVCTRRRPPGQTRGASSWLRFPPGFSSKSSWTHRVALEVVTFHRDYTLQSIGHSVYT